MPQFAKAVFRAALENIHREGLRGAVVLVTTMHMEPHKRLQCWLEAAKISQAELARRVEYDRSNLHRILNGSLRPSLQLAARIERETGGVIPAAVWAELDAARSLVKAVAP